MSPQILKLDVAGSPADWIEINEAVHYYATGMVAWAIGTEGFVFRGGVQQSTGLQSVIRASSIVAIKGKNILVREFDRPPAVRRDMVLARDRYVCAYCAQKFRESQLTLEHIIPQSKGGKDTWMNLVAACKACNLRKGARTPEKARMPLHYVPYEPNLHEGFILSNRKILADQMEFLLTGVPKSSRMHGAQ